jgi:hypothetical protein
LPTSSCHGVLYLRYYKHVGTFSCKPPRGSRGEVLLSPRVWKGCQRMGTRDWSLVNYSSPSVIRDQKHTHKLNKFKSSGLVKIFTLVLLLVCWWWSCCLPLSVAMINVSLTTVVAVAVMAARRQLQRRRWWQWRIKTGCGGVDGSGSIRWRPINNQPVQQEGGTTRGQEGGERGGNATTS